MVYILIGVFVAILTFLINYINKKKKLDKGKKPSKFETKCMIYSSIILGIISSMVLCMITQDAIFVPFKSQVFSESYSLEKIEGNQYYTISTSDDSISVYAWNGTFSEKMTFPEEVVKFNPHAKKARVQIEGKRYQEPTKKEKFWFFALSSDRYSDQYERVIISLPEGSEIKENIDPESIEADVNLNW